MSNAFLQLHQKFAQWTAANDKTGLSLEHVSLQVRYYENHGGTYDHFKQLNSEAHSLLTALEAYLQCATNEHLFRRFELTRQLFATCATKTSWHCIVTDSWRHVLQLSVMQHELPEPLQRPAHQLYKSLRALLLLLQYSDRKACDMECAALHLVKTAEKYYGKFISYLIVKTNAKQQQSTTQHIIPPQSQASNPTIVT